VFLLHNAEAFDAAVARKLDELRQSGLAERVGVSVYSAADIDRVMAQWDPDAVQLPLNLLDQRLIASGHLDRLRARGVEVHARSAFLQGVLVNDPAALPPWLDGLRPAVARLVEEVGASPKARISACLGFLAGIEAVDRIVVGAQNREQLQTIVEAADMARRVGNPAVFSVNEPALVDPSRWPQ
jgi:aryl-alcohol dehydrogenase-like predicted oxidoreductase